MAPEHAEARVTTLPPPGGRHRRDQHPLCGDPRSGFGAGAVVTLVTVAATIVIGRYWLKIPEDVLMGMLSGLQTQPAALAMAAETSQTELPNVGYATVYPFATIAKIVLAQVALMAFQSGAG